MNTGTQSTLPAQEFYNPTHARSAFVPPVLRGSIARDAVLSSKRAFDPSRAPLRVFPTQQQAFNFADANPRSPALHVWAYEIDESGRRRFFVASVAATWRWYRRIIRRGYQAPVHIYEIIRQAAACKLYFDLEFRFEDCKEKKHDGDAMVDQVVCAVGRVLSMWYPERKEDASSRCVDLDSTTSTKFSRHLIFPHLVFANNAVAGVFAKACEEQLPSECQILKFIDLSVYSKNRCFRVIGSSKFARDARLLPTRSRAARIGDRDHISLSESDFKRSLVCHVNEIFCIARLHSVKQLVRFLHAFPVTFSHLTVVMKLRRKRHGAGPLNFRKSTST
jgi:hypothetical protein